MPMRFINVPTCLRPTRTLPIELVTQHPRTHEGMLQMQFVDAAHERQIGRADGLGR